jgi:hypothetical protein
MVMAGESGPGVVVGMGIFDTKLELHNVLIYEL